MVLALNGAVSGYYQDSNPPLSSYLPDIINQGQLLLDTSSGDVYKCSDSTDQENLIWEKLATVSDVAAMISAGLSENKFEK